MIKELRLPGIAGPRRLQITHMRPPELKPGPHTYEVIVEGEQCGIGGAFFTSGYTGRRETIAVLSLTCDEKLQITSVKANSTQSAEQRERILRDQEGRGRHP